MSGLYYSAPCCCIEEAAVDCFGGGGCPPVGIIHLTITDWEYGPGFAVIFMTFQLKPQPLFACGWDGLSPILVDGACTQPDGSPTVCPDPGSQGVTVRCQSTIPNRWFARIVFPGGVVAEGAKLTGADPFGSYDEITGGFGSMTVSLPP